MSKSLQTTMVQSGVHSLAEVPAYVSVPKVPPIYMSSVFSFDDVPSLDAVYAKEAPGQRRLLPAQRAHRSGRRAGVFHPSAHPLDHGGDPQSRASGEDLQQRWRLRLQ